MARTNSRSVKWIVCGLVAARRAGGRAGGWRAFGGGKWENGGVFVLKRLITWSNWYLELEPAAEEEEEEELEEHPTAERKSRGPDQNVWTSGRRRSMESESRTDCNFQN